MDGGVLHTRALFFCSCYLWSQQDIIDKSGFLGSLVGTANERLRHAWGTLIDKIDRLIRGTKSAGRTARLPHYDERARLFSLYTRTNKKRRACLLSRVSDKNWTRLGRFTRLPWMEESYYYSSAGLLRRDGRMDDTVFGHPTNALDEGTWAVGESVL